jgi:hypothetical membrane protein
MDRVLLGCGVVAGPLFVGVFLLTGALRPAYDPLRHPVSLLALGPGGWVQSVNFCVSGLLYLAFAAGLWRTHGPWAATRAGIVLVAATAAGLVGAGIFPTDPVSGYPPGTPDRMTGRSGPAALLHDLSSAPVFLGLPVAMLLWARAFRRRGRPGWAVGSAGCAAAVLLAFVLAGAGFAQAPALVHLGGLFQRVSISVGMGWLTALGAGALRAARAGPP